MFVIDRIEGSVSVLEQDGTLQDIPLQALPDGAKEGDMLEQTAEGWRLCPEQTAERRTQLAKRRSKLLGGAP